MMQKQDFRLLSKHIKNNHSQAAIRLSDYGLSQQQLASILQLLKYNSSICFLDCSDLKLHKECVDYLIELLSNKPSLTHFCLDRAEWPLAKVGELVDAIIHHKALDSFESDKLILYHGRAEWLYTATKLKERRPNLERSLGQQEYRALEMHAEHCLNLIQGRDLQRRTPELCRQHQIDNPLHELARSQKWLDLALAVPDKRDIINSYPLSGPYAACTLIWWAAYHGKPGMVQTLLDNGSSPSPPLPVASTHQGRSLLYCLAEAELWDLFSYVLHQGEHLLDLFPLHEQHRGVPLFYLLLDKQQWPLVEALIDQGADVNIQGFSSDTDAKLARLAFRNPYYWIHELIIHEQWSLLKRLLEKSYQIFLEPQLPEEDSLLIALIKKEQWILVDKLLALGCPELKNKTIKIAISQLLAADIFKIPTELLSQIKRQMAPRLNAPSVKQALECPNPSPNDKLSVSIAVSQKVEAKQNKSPLSDSLVTSQETLGHVVQLGAAPYQNIMTSALSSITERMDLTKQQLVEQNQVIHALLSLSPRYSSKLTDFACKNLRISSHLRAESQKFAQFRSLKEQALVVIKQSFGQDLPLNSAKQQALSQRLRDWGQCLKTELEHANLAMKRYEDDLKTQAEFIHHCQGKITQTETDKAQALNSSDETLAAAHHRLDELQDRLNALEHRASQESLSALERTASSKTPISSAKRELPKAHRCQDFDKTVIWRPNPPAFRLDRALLLSWHIAWADERSQIQQVLAPLAQGFVPEDLARASCLFVLARAMNALKRFARLRQQPELAQLAKPLRNRVFHGLYPNDSEPLGNELISQHLIKVLQELLDYDALGEAQPFEHLRSLHKLLENDLSDDRQMTNRLAPAIAEQLRHITGLKEHSDFVARPIVDAALGFHVARLGALLALWKKAGYPFRLLQLAGAPTLESLYQAGNSVRHAPQQVVQERLSRISDHLFNGPNPRTFALEQKSSESGMSTQIQAEPASLKP